MPESKFSVISVTSALKKRQSFFQAGHIVGKKTALQAAESRIQKPESRMIMHFLQQYRPLSGMHRGGGGLIQADVPEAATGS